MKKLNYIVFKKKISIAEKEENWKKETANIMEIIKKTTDGNESTLRMYRINIFLNKFKYK